MKKSVGFTVFQYVTAFMLALLCLYPIGLMIISSFKDNEEIFKAPFSLPASLRLDAYARLLEQIPFGQYFVNSLIVSGVSVLFVVLTASMASFYIARFSFKWNGALFLFFLMGMMIPIKIGIVPLFILMQKLGLINSLWSLIFMYTATGIPLSVLILTSFFKTLPRELEEAGRIDGCTHWQILWHVLLPLMRPVLGTVMIVNVIQSWNDFFFPLIFIQDEQQKTIPIGMLSLFGEYSTNWSMLFAGLTLSSLPMILAFLFASRQFIEGLTQGAVK